MTITFSVCCSALQLRHIQIELTRTNNIKNTRNAFQKIFLWFEITRHVLLSVISVTLILLSAGPLRTVCNVDSILPPQIRQLESILKPFQVSSGYGLFRMMTGVGPSAKGAVQYGGLPPSIVARPELVLEGLDPASGEWKEILFRDKPTDLFQAPRHIAPHQPRLDWQMWFAALGSYQGQPWLLHLIYKLLKGDSPEVLRLIDDQNYPFQVKPPTYIRAVLYDYDFTRYNTSWARNNPTVSFVTDHPKQWWSRRNWREYLPELNVGNPSLIAFLEAHGIKNRPYLSTTKLIRKCVKIRNFSNKWLNYFVHKIICRSLYVYDYTNEVVKAIFTYIFVIIVGNFLYSRKNLLFNKRRKIQL